MPERIAFASWDFIELVCPVHGKELSLEMRKQQPTYVCTEKECSVQIQPHMKKSLQILSKK